MPTDEREAWQPEWKRVSTIAKFERSLARLARSATAFSKLFVSQTIYTHRRQKRLALSRLKPYNMFVSQTITVSYPKPTDLSRLIHEPARLHILLHLASTESELRFSELRRRLGVTQGNLASHLRMLTRAGFIEAVHLYGEPNAEYYRMTSQGRDEFLTYLEKLQAVLTLLY